MEILNTLNNQEIVNIGTVVLGTLEILFRVIPTTKNVSILDAVHTILNLVLPNRAKEKQPWEKQGKKGIFGILKRTK